MCVIIYIYLKLAASERVCVGEKDDHRHGARVLRVVRVWLRIGVPVGQEEKRSCCRFACVVIQALYTYPWEYIQGLTRHIN